MPLKWRTCATLAAHLCYSSGAPVLLGQRTCATPPPMGCRQSDDGVFLPWPCIAAAVTMHGQSRDDVSSQS